MALSNQHARSPGEVFPSSIRGCRWLLPAMMLCLLLQPAWGAGEPRTGTIIVSALNMRSGPGRHNPPIAALPEGARVVVLSYEGEWVRILFEEQTGFILNHDSYVRIDDPGEKPIMHPKTPGVQDDSNDRIQTELALSLEQVAALSNEEAAIVSALDETAKAVDSARKQVTRLSAELQAVELRIRELESQYREIELRAEVNEPYVAERISALYKLSWLGKLNLLASAESMFDFFTDRRSLELILAYDASVMSQLSQDKASLKAVIAQLATLRVEKLTTTAALSERIDAMNSERARRETVLAEVRGKKYLQLAAVEALKASARDLDQTVAAFQAESPSPASPLPMVAEKPFSALKGLLMMPVKGKIASSFGPHTDRQFNVTHFQSGINIQADRGEPIRAVYSGQTLFSSWLKGFGNMIIIDHGENYYTIYAHLEEQFKSKGDPVQAGEVIATVGDTGSLTGAGLHFEIRHHGKPMNPLGWIKRG